MVSRVTGLGQEAWKPGLLTCWEGYYDFLQFLKNQSWRTQINFTPSLSLGLDQRGGGERGGSAGLEPSERPPERPRPNWDSPAGSRQDPRGSQVTGPVDPVGAASVEGGWTWGHASAEPSLPVGTEGPQRRLPAATSHLLHSLHQVEQVTKEGRREWTTIKNTAWPEGIFF